MAKTKEKNAAKVRAPLNFTPHGATTEAELHRYENAVFSWTAPEYIRHEKDKKRYVIEAVAVAVTAIAAILVADYTMALAILVFAGVYQYLHKNHPPRNTRIVISPLGIKVGKMIFPYTHIQAFWVIYHPPYVKTLNLRVKEHFFSDVVIQLGDEDPAPVRQYLCGQIPEWEGKSERLGDVILRLLKL